MLLVSGISSSCCSEFGLLGLAPGHRLGKTHFQDMPGPPVIMVVYFLF